MATKPTPGGSDGTYGTELNEFLDESLASDGKIKTEALQTDSTAPVADAALVNKKYADDADAMQAFTSTDSVSATLVTSHTYLTQADGFVSAFQSANAEKTISAYIGDTTDPQGAGTLVARHKSDSTNDGGGVFFPVSSGRYFELSGSNLTILWWGIGSADKPVDQGIV